MLYIKVVPRGQKERLTEMLKQEMKRYEYPIKVGREKTISGSYTIKADAKPLGFPKERLVQRFEMTYLEESERLNEHEPW